MIIISAKEKSSSLYLNGLLNIGNSICLNYYDTPLMTSSYINYVNNTCNNDHVQVHKIQNATIKNLIFKDNSKNERYSIFGLVTSCSIYDSYINPLKCKDVILDSTTNDNQDSDTIIMKLFRSHQCFVYHEITDLPPEQLIQFEIFMVPVFECSM